MSLTAKLSRLKTSQIRIDKVLLLHQMSKPNKHEETWVERYHKKLSIRRRQVNLSYKKKCYKLQSVRRKLTRSCNKNWTIRLSIFRHLRGTRKIYTKSPSKFTIMIAQINFPTLVLKTKSISQIHFSKLLMISCHSASLILIVTTMDQ
jgi:hypothetical protein